jgi:Periplasmic binding protein
MEPVEDNESESRPSALRRFGPIAAVLVVIALVAGFSLVGGGGDDDDGEESTGETAAPTGELPEGVVTWSMAQEEGIDATFGDTCDTESGMVAIPFFFRTECIADVEGDNGGATADGVTGDTIKIVAWLPSDNDPIFELARRALGIDESVEEVRETYEGLVEIFQRYYQTYGRTVELEFVQASGTMLDPVAARADAVRAADMEPFAVLGGPLLANTWTEELHARGIVCMACPGTSDPAPSSFAILPSTSQIHQHVAEYIDTKLADKPAEFAGDDLNEDDRVFGLLYLAQTDNDEQNADELVERLEEDGVEVAETVTYPLDPGRAQELSASAIARFKEAGVTTVILRADPITAPAFTNEATEQGFFPEWFLAGFQFTDTTTFARGFDQEQWEHAFGISFLPPLAAPEITPAYKLYEWYFGEPPAADNALILIYPQVALFFTGVEYAGPNLTVENLRDGLFAFPPTPSAVTQPSVDYGTTIWGDDDYAGIDDMVELWWDPEAEGVDETGQEGTGMYRYVDGGKRYLPGEYSAELTVFQEEGSVTRIEDPPPAEVPPDYPSPADS